MRDAAACIASAADRLCCTIGVALTLFVARCLIPQAAKRVNLCHWRETPCQLKRFAGNKHYRNCTSADLAFGVALARLSEKLLRYDHGKKQATTKCLSVRCCSSAAQHCEL